MKGARRVELWGGESLTYWGNSGSTTKLGSGLDEEIAVKWGASSAAGSDSGSL